MKILVSYIVVNFDRPFKEKFPRTRNFSFRVETVTSQVVPSQMRLSQTWTFQTLWPFLYKLEINLETQAPTQRNWTFLIMRLWDMEEWMIPMSHVVRLAIVPCELIMWNKFCYLYLFQSHFSIWHFVNLSFSASELSSWGWTLIGE